MHTHCHSRTLRPVRVCTHTRADTRSRDTAQAARVFRAVPHQHAGSTDVSRTRTHDIRDQPGLTQTSGWADAWLSQPSAYAVAAETTADVVAAVNFAREHHLRLVVKGGGHSYQGTSDAPDSLLVWMRHMTAINLHDDFVAQGSKPTDRPQPAVTIEAGALWIDAYDAVTTVAGRYVQGGGCTTVGVAGLVQSGGFGNFSKQFGTAAAGLIEAEVVTADGSVRIANAHQNPELFWGLKGGGGGSLGVVTRMTLRTHDLPDTFGAVFGAIKANSDGAYRALIAQAMTFYKDRLFNPHWGEQMVFARENELRISMVFQGLSQAEAQATWAPFVDWVTAHPEYVVAREIKTLAMPARHFWDAEFFRQHAPGMMVADGRPGAPRDHVLWAGDQGQVGWFIHGYDSAWMPESLLGIGAQAHLVDTLFAATRHSEFALHFNKGLAGAPAEVLAAARDTATHPAVLGAFALAICGADGPPAYAGLPGPGPDWTFHRGQPAVAHAMGILRTAAPGAGGRRGAITGAALAARSRLLLVLIALVFAAPIIVAGILTFSGWEPVGKGNGQAMTPQRNLLDEKVRVQLASGQDYAWRDSVPRMTLVALPGPDCAIHCLEELTAMAKARVMLNRNQSRLRLLYLGTPPSGAGLAAMENYWQVGTDVDGRLAAYRPTAPDSVAAVVVESNGTAL
ncbi:MAG: hypothetical protein WDW36_007068 [Sanguina aurantia]